MSASLSISMDILPAGLPALAGPEQFGAFLVWVILPAVAGIWIHHFHQQQRLRRIHRRLRMLEARFAQPSALSAPMHVPAPATASPTTRPSSLTSPVRVGGVPTPPSPFTHPVPLPSLGG